MALLEVKDLKVHFKIQDGWVKAVDGITFTIDSGQTMGLVGESGCGKTTAAYAITQLLPTNAYSSRAETCWPSRRRRMAAWMTTTRISARFVGRKSR